MNARYDMLFADQVEAGKGTSKRLDVNETAFFKRSLEYVKTKTYDTKYKNLRAKEFIPVSTEAPAGADYVIWYSYSAAGMAKIIADYAHDFPRVDVYAEEHMSKIYGTGDAYGYSIKEVRRAAMAGTNLDTRKANTARRAMEELHDHLCWHGSDEYDIQGFFNYPGITEYTVQNGAGGNSEWTTKTPDEIIEDLVGLMDAVIVPTNGREVPDQILLPRARFNLIKNLRMGGSSDKTVLKYFMENNTGVAVDALDELLNQGDGGSQRMIAYVKDAEHLTQEIPLPFTQSDPEKKGMTWEIPCEAEYGGVSIYYPQSVAFGDEI